VSSTLVSSIATVIHRRWLLAFSLASAVPASAQVIHGTVTDATGTPVGGAEVAVFLGSGTQALYTVVSDPKGAFDLIVPAGRLVYVRIQRLGYDSASSTALTLKAGEAIDLAVRLGSRAIVLQDIEVVARKPADWRLRPFLERAAVNRQAGLGYIWTRADLEREHLPFVSQVVRAVPDRMEALCRGTALYIDDLPVSEENLDLLVSPEDLEGMELYRAGEMPADWAARTLVISRDGLLEINPDGLKPCRLILVWRRPYREGGGRVTFGRVARVLGFAGVVVLMNAIAW
jgi:hypothetical protein